jgi:hypothetical protein
MGCKGYCFLGLMHGRDTRLHQIPKRGRFNKGLCKINERHTIFYSSTTILDNGPTSGLLFFAFLAGHSRNARSVNGAKAPLILLGQFIMGMDAGPTIPNNGLP